MAKIKKKGTSGQAKNYITRTQAVRKLQISLQDFRRLCIFKGIYPREPRNFKKANKSATHSTTFYYTKDIQYLLHEPLIDKFREHKALAKKISRALGRGEVANAARLEKTHTPRMTLDHIIKERYPTFIDALRDLDDALSMLFLFANLPSTSAVPPKTIALCQRLCLEFKHYLIVTRSLRKSFLSIKGIYYQATIQGQDILWLVPYKFVQRVTGDIDFRIMGTFVEFYTTLLGFVNYRLYTSIGLVYPPKFNAESDAQGGELSAYTLEGKAIQAAPITNGASEPASGDTMPKATSTVAQETADKIAKLGLQDNQGEEPPVENEPEEPNKDNFDTFEPTADGADVLPQPQQNDGMAASLFAPFTFYLSRETPRQPLEFLLRAFGCKRVGWHAVLGDGAFTTNESDSCITHQIVDRPPLPVDALPIVAGLEDDSEDENPENSKGLTPGTRVQGRIYVQPQWVWDCINQGKLLRPDLYAPGATLPPHLSPWAKAKPGQYDPTLPLEEQEREGEAEDAQEGMEVDQIEVEREREFENGVSVHERNSQEDRNPLLDRDSEIQPGEGMDLAGSESEESAEDDDRKEEDDEWGGIESDASEPFDEGDAAARQHQLELEAEAKGIPLESLPAVPTPAQQRKKRRQKEQREKEEELERRMMLMPRKKRKLMTKMLYSNKMRDAEAEKLRAKRRKLEKAAA